MAEADSDRWWRPVPPGTPPDAIRVLMARSARSFSDGFVALLLPAYLLKLGHSPFVVGAIITATLVGSASLTLWVGLWARRYPRRHLLLAASLLMFATGAGFASVTEFWPLLVVAFVGTMNPNTGDVSVFLPLEHTVLAQTVSSRHRTAIFARYNLVALLSVSLGVLAASLPERAEALIGVDMMTGIRIMFALYGATGLVEFLLYRHLSPAAEAATETPAAPLTRSRKVVYRLMLVFCVDAFGGGFVGQTILATWLYQTFDISVTTAASILFWTGLGGALSQLLAAPLAQRIGLVNTMVFTHLPANIFLILVAFAPNLTTAVCLLIARSLLSSMDVPTRSSYLMAVVAPEERAAAASLTIVPRSFAQAASPLLAGWLMTLSPFGWTLLLGGGIKVVYDLMLLGNFRKVRPPEES
jgi:MFS family permease